MEKSPDAFRTISEVAEWLGVPTHVLRFWESRFAQVKPVKRAGGRRYYRPRDMELLGGIKKLLHDDGMTIRGVQKLLREKGVRHVAAFSPPIVSGVEDEDGDIIDATVAKPARKPARAEQAGADRQAPEAPMVVDAPEEREDNVLRLGAKDSPSERDTPAAGEAAELSRGPRGEIDGNDEEAPMTGFRAAKAAGQEIAARKAKIESPEIDDDPQDEDEAPMPEITGVARALRQARGRTVATNPDMTAISTLYGRLVQLRDRMAGTSGTDSTD